MYITSGVEAIKNFKDGLSLDLYSEEVYVLRNCACRGRPRGGAK